MLKGAEIMLTSRASRMLVHTRHLRRCPPISCPVPSRVLLWPRLQPSRAQSATHSPRPPILQRAVTFLRENPYTRFSLVLCGVVLSFSLAFEFYKKFKRKKVPDAVLMPPRVGHFTVHRSDDLAYITRRVQALRRSSSVPAIVYLVGPSGAGKSELAYQYAEQFAGSAETGWLKPKPPVVLYLNGATAGLFETTLREAAMSMGVRESELALGSVPVGQRVASIATAMRAKLSESKQAWLIVVDGLKLEALPVFRSTFCDSGKAKATPNDDWDWMQGAVLVTTQDSQSFPNESTVELNGQLSQGLALQLLRGLVGQTVEEAEAKELLECLQRSPLAIALAASTIKVYRSFLEKEPTSSPVAEYAELLSASLPPSPLLEDVLRASLALYTEAASSNPRVKHTMDLLGSCDMEHPIPAIAIAHHLSHPFYSLPPLTPPPFPSPSTPPEEGGVSSTRAYIQQLKAMLPFTNASAPSDVSQSDMADYLQALQDQVPYLRDCPLLTFKKYRKTGVELVSVHSAVRSLLPQLFLKYTAPGLDHAHLKQAEEKFNKTAWFRRYRTFDPSHALQAYHRSLPGLSAAAGVLTESQFEKDHYIEPPLPVAITTYSEYAHCVSHYHRVISSLVGVLKSLGGDVEDMQLKTYLQPQLRAASRPPFVSESDQLSCSYSLASIEAFLSSTEEYPVAVQKLGSVLEQQRAVLGHGHPAVARTLTDMADLKFSLGDAHGARHFLEAAVTVYEKLPMETINKQAVDIGLALASLGLVLSNLGEKKRSCQLLEQALGHYQVVQEGENVTSTQRKLVASTLIDLAHTYLSLGDITNAKKYIDLANLATHNIYQEAHPETIRALNVMSVVYALLGDKPESHRIRQEAGKLKNQLDTQPMC